MTVNTSNSEEPASGWGPRSVRSWPLITLGAVIIAATYLGIILTQSTTLGHDLGPTTLVVLAGYLAGAVLIAMGTLPTLTTRTLVLVPGAIATNIVAGQIVGVSPLPLYLDSLGTVLVAILAGPAAGAATGVLTNLLWGLVTPSAIPFAAGSALVGCAAGLWARLLLRRRIQSHILRLGLFTVAGGLTGVLTGMLSAPVAAFVFGGGLGVGTGSLVAVLQASGQSMLEAATVQSLISDPLDKALCFLIAVTAAGLLPTRLLARFPAPARGIYLR
ncbi:hypothetical protein [Devriesea agamarum]|uniref:hypothetical protein n=1 Tax=Devriesea agamarum TaxID=472569 RepID=UPI00071E4E04|nr:hypothetical protein [Devriesea agamarum]